MLLCTKTKKGYRNAEHEERLDAQETIAKNKIHKLYSKLEIVLFELEFSQSKGYLDGPTILDCFTHSFHPFPTSNQSSMKLVPICTMV